MSNAISLVFPLHGGHAGEVAEGAGEGFVVGEAGFGSNDGEFHVGIVAHELLGVADAVFVDELRDGTAARDVDAVGDVANVGIEGVGKVGEFQTGTQIVLFVLHELHQTLHELFLSCRRLLRVRNGGCGSVVARCNRLATALCGFAQRQPLALHPKEQAQQCQQGQREIDGPVALGERHRRLGSLVGTVANGEEPDAFGGREPGAATGNATRRNQVAVGRQDGDAPCGLGQWVGIIECQGGWSLGIVNAKDVGAAYGVATHDVTALRLAVDNDGGVIDDRILLVLHGNRHGGGQQREGGIAYLTDSHAPYGIPYWQQIGEDALFDIANETIISTGSIGQQVWLPRIEKRYAEGRAFQSVDNAVVADDLPVVVPIAAYHHHVAVGQAEEIGQAARHRHLASSLEIHAAIVGLDGISVIPVAGGNNLSAGQFDSGNMGPSPVETAKTLESMGSRVVALCLDGLADAEILLVAACQQYLTATERYAEPVVVGIGHRHHVPLAVLQIFGRRRRHKTGGMTARHRQFTVGGVERGVAEAGDV